MSRHALAELTSLQLGRVTDNTDPEGRGRVLVRLLALEMEVWASVVTPSAGNGYGASMLPRVGEVVVIAFLSPELPLVLGSIWSGDSSTPAEADPQEDVYVLRTPSGVVVEMDDGDGPRVELRTPAGHSIVITDGDGGEVTVTRGGQSVKLTSSEISVESSGTVSVQASQVKISAGMVQVDAGMSKFSGVVQADTVIANAVVSSSYTPGAGNIW
jgi:uncharacterized protein involved in type VI secretion and phage assembly